MFPAKFAPVLFGLILSGLMSCVVSGLSTWRSLNEGDAFLSLWGANWIVSWMVAFVIVLFVAPITRRLVARLVKD